MQALIPPAAMPPVPGLDVPTRFYTVLPGLAGMSYPRAATPWQVLFNLGYRQIVDLTGDPPPRYDPAPLVVLERVRLQDLYGLPGPDDPEHEVEQIVAVVRLIKPVWEQGQGIIVHCAGGTGRTGTVIGCVLRDLGYPFDEVIAYLDQLNRARGNTGWPEASWQAELVRDWPA